MSTSGMKGRQNSSPRSDVFRCSRAFYLLNQRDLFYLKQELDWETSGIGERDLKSSKCLTLYLGLLWWLRAKESTCNAGAAGDMSSKVPLQYSCWRIPGAAKRRTQLKWLSTCVLGREPWTLLLWNLMGILLPTPGPLMLLQMACISISMSISIYVSIHLSVDI